MAKQERAIRRVRSESCDIDHLDEGNYADAVWK
jgi:hypothetical protein